MHTNTPVFYKTQISSCTVDIQLYIIVHMLVYIMKP